MNKYNYLAILLYLLLFPYISVAQTETNIVKEPLTQAEINKILNTAFNSLVTSNSNPGEIATYASLDPINTSFILKGTFPLHKNLVKVQKGKSFKERLQSDTGSVSYFSFSLSGNLIDKKYGVLFSNSLLNAGINFQAQYNFRLKAPLFSFSRKEWEDISLRRDMLFSVYHQNIRVLETSYSDSAYNKNKYLLELQKRYSTIKISKSEVQLDLLNKTIDSLGTSVMDRPEMIDSLLNLIKATDALKNTLVHTILALDSLEQAKNHDLFLLNMNQQALLQPKLKKDYDSLLMKATLRKTKLSWVSLVGGIAKANYVTYDPSLSFSSQITKNNLNTFNLGIAVNWIKIDKIKKRTLFLNGNLSWLRDNNLSDLSTIEIDQSKKVANLLGDTTRVITSKYNVYTDPVINFYAWNISGNLYYIYGETPSGFHVFPSINFQNNGLTAANLSLGYIIAFKNTTKDQPIINTEIYLTFKDIFNDHEKTKKFWNRNEIGISFTVPFNVLN